MIRLIFIAVYFISLEPGGAHQGILIQRDYSLCAGDTTQSGQHR